MKNLTQDEYLCVVNSSDTYEYLAEMLKDYHDQQVIFAWTDTECTQLDILLSYMPPQFGNLQRGMSTATDLFVSVSGCGMFGFELNGNEKSPAYVGKKLGLGGINITTEKLAELINGVCRELKS